MAINSQWRDSASPAELATHPITVEASREPLSILTINGGSSSIRFALYEEGDLLLRRLIGKVDRIGLSGRSMTFEDSTGKSQDTGTIDLADHPSAVAFLLDWLETLQPFASVKAVGHRVVHGMTHSKPERVTQELLDELHRITPRENPGRALLIGLVQCGKCGHNMKVHYKQGHSGRYQYCCQSGRKQYGKRSCQHLSGCEIDAAVSRAFFEAIRPAEIDALQEYSKQQVARHDQLVDELDRDVQRLQFATHRAEQQYDHVDPRNRLIAASLEAKWESALQALTTAQDKLKRTRQESPQPTMVPRHIREAFADIGTQLPEKWPELSSETRRALLRTLVTQVNLLREPDGKVQIRIVWKGRLVTEDHVQLRSLSLRGSEIEQQVVERIRVHSSHGLNSHGIARQLNEEGLRPCRGEEFTGLIVTKLKRRFGIQSNFQLARRGNLPFAWTLSEIALQINRHPSWISRQIHRGSITITADDSYGCYLFPKTDTVLSSLNALRDGSTRHVEIPEVHTNG